MDKLNNTQQKIYDFLVDRLSGGVPPSVREIGAAVENSQRTLAVFP